MFYMLGDAEAQMRDVVQNDLGARMLVEINLGIKISEPYTGLLLMDGKRPIGACIFNNHEAGRNIHFTCVMLEPYVGMRIARRVAWYVFKVMGCRRCTATTPRSNIKAIAALESIGFKLEGVMREYFPNDDGLVYGILRSEQKLLRGL